MRQRAFSILGLVCTLLLVIAAVPSASASPKRSVSAPVLSNKAVAAGSWWKPMPGVTWQWQLAGAVDTSVGAQVYDLDGFDASVATVSELEQRGVRTICYISAGSYESWRPDAAQFAVDVRGHSNGWPGEKWLDVRNTAELLPLMERRVAMCASKGFDAVEFDNVDAYSNDSGFSISAAQQFTYNVALANLAHRYRLAAVLKNNPQQAASLMPYFDIALSEQCYEYDECSLYLPFVEAGKPVLIAEYDGSFAEHCNDASRNGFSLIGKNEDLDAVVRRC